MGFWGALFGGKNDTLNQDIDKTGQIAGYATGQGEKNLSSASDFWRNIVSGDSSKISQSLAPEIDAVKSSTANDQKTNSMFNARSGGTAASNNAASDKAHGYITNLIGNLTGNAVSSLASTGSNELSTGLSATGQQAELSQERYQNWMDSILGKGVTTAAAAGEAYGLGKIGMPPPSNNDDNSDSNGP